MSAATLAEPAAPPQEEEMGRVTVKAEIANFGDLSSPIAVTSRTTRCGA